MCSGGVIVTILATSILMAVVGRKVHCRMGWDEWW